MTDTIESKPKSAAKPRTTRSKKTEAAPRGKLVVVESPAKARTIGKYLGRGYTVKASMGHVRDLPKSSLGVNVDSDFDPTYLIPRDKSKVVKELRESVKGAKEIILATDPDREGEAIAWHLVAATGAEDKPVSRVVFHEITPEAISAAMEHPREIDMDLVDAQQARRVLDRLVGYSVSPLLWKKVKRGLSAGRVQTAALRMVVERERQIQEFVPVESWTVEAILHKQTGTERERALPIKATVVSAFGGKADLKTEEDAAKVLAGLDGAAYQVRSVKTRESQRRPQPPFTTSTLQQEASRKLGFPVRRTMQIAQELYEGIDLKGDGIQGLITYMRTDSTNVSESAQQTARAVISGKFGPEYVPDKPPVYRKRAKGAQEAHEAIRPTAPQRDPASIKPYLTAQQFRLYQLIWQRFLASQMRPAILDGTTVDINAGSADQVRGDAPFGLRATGSVIKFKGYMAVYTAGKDDGDEDELDKGALPALAEQESLDLESLTPAQHFTQPPPRFSEAMLVKELEECGIGRPSTYAPTIATLLARSYVATEEKRLVPTELGFVVSDLLAEHFPNVFEVGFTSQMEDELDEIAAGDREWVPTIREFYGPFHDTLNRAEQTIERVKLKDEPAGEDCEKCGRPMLIKLGRFGKFMACSGFPECRNSRPLLLKIGMTCPTCKEGDVVERRSKKGRTFYGCSRFPECDFVTWNKPVEVSCPRCGSPYMTEMGRKGQLKCPSCGHVGSSLTAAS
ncbi:MAG: type I DNA topoisomerase [Thermomicrobiales bacterium]|jgi:DNA topoisomerase-1|nr:type I DNA topoisomerase [Thermomicrobiales bacterium]